MRKRWQILTFLEFYWERQLASVVRIIPFSSQQVAGSESAVFEGLTVTPRVTVRWMSELGSPPLGQVWQEVTPGGEQCQSRD